MNWRSELLQRLQEVRTVCKTRNQLSVKPWPIYERQDGGNIMYYMIYATDHPVAPELMLRAYQKAVKPKESYEQLSMELQEQNLI